MGGRGMGTEEGEGKKEERTKKGVSIGGKKIKTYNTRDSLVVTGPTTSLALAGLSMGERTGSRVLQWVWSYAVCRCGVGAYYLGSEVEREMGRDRVERLSGCQPG